MGQLFHLTKDPLLETRETSKTSEMHINSRGDRCKKIICKKIYMPLPGLESAMSNGSESATLLTAPLDVLIIVC